MNLSTITVTHNVVKHGAFPIDFILDGIKSSVMLHVEAKATSMQFLFQYVIEVCSKGDVESIINEIKSRLDYHYTSFSLLTL